jgi:taurine---2-oxoglutarate transaminase
VLGTERAMDFDDVSTGSTWSWLPAACAAALAALDVFEREPVLENVRALEAAGLAKLEAMRARHLSIGQVRAIGCFMAIEFVKDRETKERDLELQERVAWAAIRRGVLADPSTTSFNIQPSLVTSVEVLERGLDLIDDAIAEATGA